MAKNMKNQKAHEILQDLLTLGKKSFVDIESDYNKRRNRVFNFGREDVFSYDDIMNKKYEITEDSCKLPEISNDLLNKKIAIGDFNLYTLFNTYDYTYNQGFGSLGTSEVDIQTFNTITIVVEYHGCYLLLGCINQEIHRVGQFCREDQTNWFRLKPTNEKPYVDIRVEVQCDLIGISYFEKIYDLIASLEIDNVIDVKLELDIPRAGSSAYINTYDMVNEIRKLTCDSIDIEWFVKKEIINGVYKPSKSMIDVFLFSWQDYSDKYPTKIKIKELGVNTIQFTDSSHFNIGDLNFDMTGVNIKASKKVIEKYNYIKYVSDDKIKNDIKADRERQKKDHDLLVYNNTFTLMQHGKIIKENVHKQFIIDYLEQHSYDVKNFEKNIINNIQPIFDKYKIVDKIYICYWGKYSQNELRGEKKELDFECDQYNTHIPSDVWKEITELYENELMSSIEEKTLNIKYGGFDEYGGTILGIKKLKNGKLDLFTEDINFE